MAFLSPTRSERRLAELSALADGTLAPRRRAALEQRIERSPELRAAYERERRAVALLREARERDRAPDHLRRRLEAQRAARSRVARRPVAVAGGALTAAIVALALVLVLIPGSAGAPSVAQAAQLGMRGAQAAPPRPDPDHPDALAQAVGTVSFPDWARSLGWIATGQRFDRLGGHRAVTVYYRRYGQQVAYTIVSVPALRQPAGPTIRVARLRLRTLRVSGHSVVTWRRDERTCVLTSTDASARELELLAAYSPPPAGYR